METKQIAADLKRAIQGDVHFDVGTRAAYAYDASIFRQMPIGVVIPKTKEDVIAAVDIAREHGAPILGRGCATSLAGQCCNTALIIDFSRYLDHLIELDPSTKTAHIQPGIIRDHLTKAGAPHQLMFGPDPTTRDHNTLGGMIGNNSCGTHSVIAGRTAENVHELEILTYDGLHMTVGPTTEAEIDRIIAGGGRRGEIYAGLRRIRDTYGGLVRKKFPKIPRRVSGYNLDELLPGTDFNVARALVGTEGTCALVLEAKVRMVHSPPQRAIVVISYRNVAQAGYDTPFLMSNGPIGCEFFDGAVVDNVVAKGHHYGAHELLPKGRTFAVVEFGGDEKGEADAAARRFIARLPGDSRAIDHRMYGEEQTDEQHRVWQVRLQGCTSREWFSIGGNTAWPNWEDAAVPPDRLGDYLTAQSELLERHGYHPFFFGHLGQGCIHCRIDFELRTEQGVKNFRKFMEDSADIVIAHGGSLSGEHGDGHGRAELLPKMFGPELMQAFAEFKGLWDPQGRMNPGKLVNPYRLDQHLREGPAYQLRTPQTHFSFHEDGHSMAEAANRCIGVGNCRHLEGGVMCPSFMVTREEKHSTRGRARLLQEMLRGESPVKAPWRSEPVKEALHLCLGCKGCKGECPIRVDMATYKAEFLAHYFAGRLRPRSAYAMGLIMYWARFASRMPRAVNAVMHAPVLGSLLKLAGGIAPQRDIPRFATQTFRDWFRTHEPRYPSGQRVILWPDTFNNYFYPQTAIAATEVLESAGYRVELPKGMLCCGRPLYDYGMLGLAKRFLRGILESLRDEIRANTPIVGLEPSCLSVFRDEMINMFPHDLDAQRLAKNTHLLSEFLAKNNWEPPKLKRKAIVQRHCHHQSVLGFGDESKLLDKLEIDCTDPGGGCCGMAGSFGYEAGDRYDVSLKCGERALLPAVRKASDDVLLIANGFSCREQIRQSTGRKTLHLAEVLALALTSRRTGNGAVHKARNGKSHAGRIVLLTGSLVAAGALAWRAANVGKDDE